MHDSVTFHTFAMLCSGQLYSVSEHFHHPQEATPCPVSSYSLPKSLQPLATTNLLSVFMDLPILDISYKWDPTVWASWWLNGKESACNAGDAGSISGSGRPLKKKMATHASTLAWEIPWTEEHGGLPSTGHKESVTTETKQQQLYGTFLVNKV